MRSGELILGIDCGGTRSVAILATREKELVKYFEAGPGNIKLLGDKELSDLLGHIADGLDGMNPRVICIGMAGLRTDGERKRVESAVQKIWPNAALLITNDLRTAIAAAEVPDDAGQVARVLVVSGTGSCCYGRSVEGKEAKSGGWGHLLGDRGSGYSIAMEALRGCVREFEKKEKWPRLGGSILTFLLLNEPEEVIAWAQQAEKHEIAGVASVVLSAAQKNDPLARKIVNESAMVLAEEAIHCAQKIARGREPVLFIFSGGQFTRNTIFAQAVHRRILKLRRPSATMILQKEPAWGAVELASRLSAKKDVTPQKRHAMGWPEFPSAAHSPTEKQNPRSLKLDSLSTKAFVDLMAKEDSRLPSAIRKVSGPLSQIVERVARSLKKDGRLFYTGAGTSGRLGVFDASECPPTFRTDPEMVQGIIAGGNTALWRAVEGAEDDFGAGQRSMEFREVSAKDVVIGIASSGRTPFVWGTIEAAQKAGAYTVLLTCNPHLKFPFWPNGRELKPDKVIVLDSGPEVLTGSTRLKAGTVTKLALNIVSTGAMIRIGKVIGNLMVDLNPSNSKLKERAVRIVCKLTGVNEAQAKETLIASKWDVKKAYRKLS